MSETKSGRRSINLLRRRLDAKADKLKNPRQRQTAQLTCVYKSISQIIRKMFCIKLRYSLKKKLRIGLVILVLFVLLHPSMNGRRSYEYIEKDDIIDNLHEELTANFTSTAIADCEYFDAVFDDTTLSLSLVDEDLVEGHRIREGGEFAPRNCKPKYSTAVIVPYRFVFTVI